MGRVLGLFVDSNPTGHVRDEVVIKNSKGNKSIVDCDDGFAPHCSDYSASI